MESGREEGKEGDDTDDPHRFPFIFDSVFDILRLVEFLDERAREKDLFQDNALSRYRYLSTIISLINNPFDPNNRNYLSSPDKP